jgi:hypothetical protein
MTLQAADFADSLATDGLFVFDREQKCQCGFAASRLFNSRRQAPILLAKCKVTHCAA